VSSDKPRESARGATDEEALAASPGALRRPVSAPRTFITRFFDSRESGFSLSLSLSLSLARKQRTPNVFTRRVDTFAPKHRRRQIVR